MLYFIEGFKQCIIAVDCFSKLVEIFLITNNRDETTTNRLCQELLPRFGKPRWIWLDQGNEFKGEFSKLYKAIRIFI